MFSSVKMKKSVKVQTACGPVLFRWAAREAFADLVRAVQRWKQAMLAFVAPISG
jgi:hypothetical protein